jgi:hypothetical protein
MDTELVRACADELAFLAARLNRRAGEMESMDPESGEFRNAVRIANFLAREIAAAVHTCGRPRTVWPLTRHRARETGTGV